MVAVCVCSFDPFYVGPCPPGCLVPVTGGSPGCGPCCGCGPCGGCSSCPCGW